MQWLNKLFNNNANAEPVNNDPFFDVIYNYFANGSDDFDVDSKGALVVSSDIYAITSRIANDIADKPITTGTAYVSTLLNKNINNYMSTRDWEVATYMNLLVYGDSFSHIETNSNGMVQSITLLPTYAVTVLQNNNGLQYHYMGNGQDVTYNDNEILHFKLNTINGLVGTSPLVALKNTLKMARASDRLLQNYFDNGAFNKVLLQVSDKLSSKDRKKIKEAFKDNLGAKHGGGSIVSDDSVKVTPFNTSGVNGDILKNTKNNDYFSKKIASVYGVPSAILGVVNAHSNNADVMANYQQDLKPYEKILTSELNNKLNGTYTIQDPIHVNNATDVANLAKTGAITQQQAGKLLGLN